MQGHWEDLTCVLEDQKGWLGALEAQASYLLLFPLHQGILLGAPLPVSTWEHLVQQTRVQPLLPLQYVDLFAFLCFHTQIALLPKCHDHWHERHEM